MPSRPSRCVLLTGILALAGCAKTSGNEVTIEGTISVVMEYGGLGDSGIQLTNHNFMVANGTAYYLMFQPFDVALVGLDRQEGGNAVSIPAPAALGDVTIFTEATYRAQGRVHVPRVASPGSGSPTATGLMSLEEITERVNARMDDPQFAKLDMEKKIQIALEPDYLDSVAFSMPKTFAGCPTKLLRLTRLELIKPLRDHESARSRAQ